MCGFSGAPYIIGATGSSQYSIFLLTNRLIRPSIRIGQGVDGNSSWLSSSKVCTTIAVNRFYIVGSGILRINNYDDDLKIRLMFAHSENIDNKVSASIMLRIGGYK